jgi:50S ribosomal protein L16 3-hydroxylase
VATQLAKVEFTEHDMTIFLGEYLSELKPTVFFKPAARPLSLVRFLRSATRRGIRLSIKTRMLYRGRHIFINGESYAVSQNDKALLTEFANNRTLEGSRIATASDDVLESLYIWYQDGWITLG